MHGLCLDYPTTSLKTYSKRILFFPVGRRLANNCGCKFIEASSGIAHNVDELLVGILAQVQLNPKRLGRRPPRSSGPGGGARLLARLLGLRRRARSCENLFVIWRQSTSCNNPIVIDKEDKLLVVYFFNVDCTKGATALWQLLRIWSGWSYAYHIKFVFLTSEKAWYES